MRNIFKRFKFSHMMLGVLFVVLIAGSSQTSRTVLAQDTETNLSDEQTRKMVVEEYQKKRKASRISSKRAQVHYQPKKITPIPPSFARKTNKGNLKTSSNQSPRSKKPLVMIAKSVRVGAGRRPGSVTTGGKTIGITFWRLRPSRADDTSRRITQRTNDGKLHEWTPERIESETVLANGDRLRVSIESPDEGYLYVINSEYYADGSVGTPYLIFPTTVIRGGNNRLEAGRLVDIPARSDPQPWFNVEARDDDLTGELLTIIVSKTPLELPVGQNELELDWKVVFGWNDSWGAPVERIEQVGSVGRGWSKEEEDASASDSRRITQDDPMPQTIYHVATRPSDPLILTVPLAYKNFASR